VDDVRLHKMCSRMDDHGLVYDPVYCKVMTIMVCDMQFEDTKVECILRKKLNVVVDRKGLGTPTFKGFMVYGAQANWNVVRIVYGIGDPTAKMVDKE